MERVIRWTPRLIGLGLVGSLAVLALDTVTETARRLDVPLAFAVHLIPAAIALAALLLAWRWPRAGGVLCFALAIGYALMVRGRISWMVAISAPLVLVGVLFLWSSELLGQPHARATQKQ